MFIEYTIKVSTLAEFQAAVVKWLEREMIDYRAKARGLARTKKGMKEYNDKADILEYAAKFVKEIVIESPVVDPLKELDQQFINKLDKWITHPWEFQHPNNDIPVSKENINKGIMFWIKDDKLIQAIKCYRYHTNVGLLEAKQYVEKLRDGA